jgi:Zn ribbon nucleic-acid-binding protein
VMSGLLALFALVLLVVAWRIPRDAQATPVTRDCPAGHGPVTPLTTTPGAAGRSYEVFACTACGFAETTVHGTRSPFAYCPACQQRALRTDLERESGVVHVSEQCQLCGYRGEGHFLVPRDGDDSHEAQPDNVIPFRARNRDSTP